jgi:hypothetical protein
MERITGIISTGNLTAYTRGVDGSTEQAHSSGAVIEYIWNADDLNDLVDGILVCHNQVGNIKSGAQIDDTSADHQYILGVSELSADRTITLPLLTGNDDFVFEDHIQTLTNKTLTTPTITSPTISGAGGTTAGQQGYDATNKAIFIGDGAAKQSIFTSAWKAYTPTTANITAGSGSTTGKYCQIGKTVIFWASFVMAADSTMGTSPTFTLPVTAAAVTQANFACTINDAGTVVHGGIGFLSSDTVIQPLVWSAAAAYIQYAGISATVPMTWTTNDYVIVYGTYEAA